MRLLVVTSSPTDEVHLSFKNMTIRKFRQPQRALAKSLGGALEFNSLASAILQHIICEENFEFGGGCVAFRGGSRMNIEDSL